MVNCPKCGAEANELYNVDPALKSKLEEAGQLGVPPEVCVSCISELRRSVSKATGGVLIAQERAKESHRLNLWKSRVGLIKQARQMMNEKKLGEAAVLYEKYLKVLEIVFELKKGEKLTPELFKESARTQELTVVASVYWDLIRIYDSSPKYLDRQMTAAKQLSSFIQFTPIFPDLIKKAEMFQRTAHNPEVIKQFLKMAAAQKGRCFVATYVYQNPSSIELQQLRFFRDQYLRKTYWGRNLVYWYYQFSPQFVLFLQRHKIFNSIFQRVFRGVFVICFYFIGGTRTSLLQYKSLAKS